MTDTLKDTHATLGVMHNLKNNMRNIFIFIITVFLIQSCVLEVGEQLVTVEGKYSLLIPSFLTKASTLNEDASLTYQNDWKEFYVMVIDEPRDGMHEVLVHYELVDIYQNNIQVYSKLVLDGFRENLINPTQSALIETTINGMPAKLTTLRGTVDGVDVFISIGMYEGKDRYYQVLVSTISSKENIYKSKMSKILHSLKELKSTEDVQ